MSGNGERTRLPSEHALLVTADAKGAFHWVGLATSDPPRACSFYTNVFGWRAEMRVAGELGPCTVFRNGSTDTALVYGQTREARAARVLPHWTPFASSEDVEESLQRARRLGARVLRSPFTVPGLGRAAAVRDPVGAIVALWQPVAKVTDGTRGRVSAVWYELVTSDPDRATAFYRDLFGWDVVTAGGARSGTIHDGLGPIGWIRGSSGRAHAPTGGWLPYIVVESAESAIRRAGRLGGVALRAGTVDGSFALADPQGAEFAVVDALKLADMARS